MCNISMCDQHVTKYLSFSRGLPPMRKCIPGLISHPGIAQDFVCTDNILNRIHYTHAIDVGRICLFKAIFVCLEIIKGVSKRGGVACKPQH